MLCRMNVVGATVVCEEGWVVAGFSVIIRCEVSWRMSTSTTTIKESLAKSIMDVVTSMFDTCVRSVKVDYPKNSEHGDYASAVAMEVGKRIRKNPLEVAEEFQRQLEGNVPEVDRIPL